MESCDLQVADPVLEGGQLFLNQLGLNQIGQVCYDSMIFHQYQKDRCSYDSVIYWEQHPTDLQSEIDGEMVFLIVKLRHSVNAII